MSNFGYLVIFFGMALIAIDHYREKPSGWRLSAQASLMLVFGALGYAIVNQDSVTDADFGRLGSIHKAATQAINDAKTVSDLKNRVQQQSDAIDIVAQQAGRANAAIKSADEELKKVRMTLSNIDRMLKNSTTQLKKIERRNEFASEVQSAANDSRVDFEKLLARARDPANDFQKEAAAAASEIFYQHNLASITQYNGSWNKSLNENTLSFDNMVNLYANERDPGSRLSIIQHINNSPRFSSIFKVAFDVGVVKESASINKVEIAIRGFDQIEGKDFGALAIEEVLDWWYDNIKQKDVLIQLPHLRNKSPILDLKRGTPSLTSSVPS